MKKIKALFNNCVSNFHFAIKFLSVRKSAVGGVYRLLSLPSCQNLKGVLFIFCFFIFGLAGPLYAQIRATLDPSGQQRDFDELIQYFQSKSKRQKNIGWLLIGSGVGLTMIASAVQGGNSSDESNLGQTIVEVGAAAEIASIPLFFAASKSKNKARQIYFQKNIESSVTDSARRYWVDEAVFYFRGKASSNQITGIVLSVIGGGLFMGGIARHSKNDPVTIAGFLDDIFTSYFLITSGIATGLMSIPFYIRAGSHRRTMRSILRSGRVPDPTLSFSPNLSVGHGFVTIGLSARF